MSEVITQVSGWYEYYQIRLHSDPFSVWKTTLFICIILGVVVSIIVFLLDIMDLMLSAIIGIGSIIGLFILINIRGLWSSGAIKQRCATFENREQCIRIQTMQQRILNNQ